MSEKYRPLRFNGVSRADSLTWNPHKLLGTLLQCSTFHLKEKVKLHGECLLEVILSESLNLIVNTVWKTHSESVFILIECS